MADIKTYNHGVPQEEAAGLSAGFGVTKSNIAEMQIYLTNLHEDLPKYSPILQEYLAGHRPAATLLGIESLPGGPGQLIEIRVIAHTD